MGLIAPHRVRCHRRIGPQKFIDLHCTPRHPPIITQISVIDAWVNRLLIGRRQVPLRRVDCTWIIIYGPVPQPVAPARRSVTDHLSITITGVNRVMTDRSDCYGARAVGNQSILRRRPKALHRPQPFHYALGTPDPAKRCDHARTLQHCPSQRDCCVTIHHQRTTVCSV